MSKNREAYKKRVVNTYRVHQEEVLAALDVHVPSDAGVSWNVSGNFLEVTVERVERKVPDGTR